MNSIVNLLKRLTFNEKVQLSKPKEVEIEWEGSQLTLALLLCSCLIHFVKCIIFSPTQTSLNTFQLLTTIFITAFFIFSCKHPLPILNYFFPLIFAIEIIILASLYPRDIIETIFFALTTPLLLTSLTKNLKAIFMGLLMPALLLIAYVPLYSRSIHYIKDDPRLFDNVIKSSISTFIQLSFLALTRTLYQEKTSVFYSGLIERKFKEFERNSSFMDSFLQEIRDLAFKIQTGIKGVTGTEISKKALNEMTNSKSAMDMLLHCADNYLERGLSIICDFSPSPVYTQVFASFEKTWNLCAETLKSQGLKATLKIEKQCPSVLKLDNYRLFQILTNLFGHSMRVSRKGVLTVTIKWLPGLKKITSEIFDPIPFDDDGVYEKDLMIEALTRKKNEEIHHILTLENKRFDDKLLQTYYRGGPGILKIVYTDTGCDSTQSMPFDKNSQFITDEFVAAKMKKSLGLFITKQVCIKMGGDLKVNAKANKGLGYVVCLPIST